MTVEGYQLVSFGSVSYIKDTTNSKCYRFEDIGREQLAAAVDILNSLDDHVDLSRADFRTEGLYIGDRLLQHEEIDGYADKYRHISRMHPPVARDVDRVGRDTMDLRRRDMGSTALAAQGELDFEEDFFTDRTVDYRPETESPEAAKGALSSVGKFFKRLKSFVAVGIFQRIFSPAKYKLHHQEKAAKFMAPTDQKIDRVRNYQVKQNGSRFAHVPSDLLLSQELRDETGLDAKIGGKEAVPDGGTVVVESFVSGQHTVTGYDVRGVDIEPGSVVPTSTRYHSDKDVGNHLINCYMTQKAGVGIIRTGVIDTAEKAEEFEKAARELHRQMGRKDDDPVRVMSHQLNSNERESKMIKSQHAQLLARATNKFQVGHLNAPCNRFYHHHKKWSGIPFVSDILDGEKKSHEQNVEGMVIYLAWILDDLERSEDPEVRSLAAKLKQKDVGNILALQRKLGGAIIEAQNLKVKLEELEEEAKEWTSDRELGVPVDQDDWDEIVRKTKEAEANLKTVMEDVTALRRDIIHGDGQKTGLKELHKYLEQVLEVGLFESGRLDENPELNKASQTLHIYRRLLGAQLEVKGAKIDRNQEHLMLFALDKRLGVITAMNCKSGLDRTGFLFALFLSAMDLPEDKVLEIALNWESYSLELNGLYKEKGYNPDLVATQLSQMGERGKNLKVVFDMQQNVLQHLLKVSLPITGKSTGLIGLKYQKGISENLLPLYCIPPVVMTDDGTVKQILTYTSKGHPKGLTPEGHALITQLSPYRGA